MLIRNLNKNISVEVNFVTFKDKKPVYIFTIKNRNGIEILLTNYGGKLISLKTPDKFGNYNNIVLGYDKVEDYFTKNPYFGAIVGRYANRIKSGKFKLGNEEYHLARNNGNNHLHGGEKGFQSQVWDVKGKNETDSCASISFVNESKHLEEGYPGNLIVNLTYTLNNNDELVIDYQSETDKKTIINLTHHSFFNLEGEGSGNILDHILEINADQFVEINDESIPTGIIKDVKKTPLDFRKAFRIGSRIDEAFDQLKFGNGYDHCFVLNQVNNKVFDARITELTSGRCMEVITSEPGLQFYSGNYLSKQEIGKGGKIYNKREAFCLETQHFPDSPNHPSFPSTVLNSGEQYNQKTIYRFSVVSVRKKTAFLKSLIRKCQRQGFRSLENQEVYFCNLAERSHEHL